MLTCNKKFKIFISYSHKDKGIVSSFAQKLEDSKIQFYVDIRHALPGVNLTRDIFENGISKSNLVLVFWSENSLESKWVRFEILLSEMFDKILIPVIVDEVGKRNLNIGFVDLSLKKYVDFTKFNLTKSHNFDPALSELIGVIRSWYKKLCLYNFLVDLKTKYSYSFSTMEEEFYILAHKKILKRRSNNIIFKAETPALLLKGEAFTSNRQEYLNKLFWVYSQKQTFNGIYLFDYRKTFLGVHEKNFIEYAKASLGKVDLSRLNVMAVRPRSFASFLPSVILGERTGYIILREPVKSKFIGLIFISRKELESVRKFYLNLLVERKNVFDIDYWGRKILHVHGV